MTQVSNDGRYIWDPWRMCEVIPGCCSTGPHIYGNNARRIRAHIADDFLWRRRHLLYELPLEVFGPQFSWTCLERVVAQRNCLPWTLKILKTVLFKEWDLLPQTFIHTIIHSMIAHCEACIALYVGYTPHLTDFSRDKSSSLIHDLKHFHILNYLIHNQNFYPFVLLLYSFYH